MLSTGAFNALLKILEEPPVHVKFILATTEIEKIPDTILSRSLRYDFLKIDQADIETRLRDVAKQENITLEDAACEMIARRAKGGMRDALTLFEQYIIDGAVTSETVSRYLQVTSSATLARLFSDLRSGNSESVSEILKTLSKENINVRLFFEECLLYVRDCLIREM